MTFNLSTFVFEIINFLVLMYLLERILYRPLHSMVDRRRDAISRAQDEAEARRREAEALKHELEERARSTDQERREILDRARRQAETQRQSLLAAAEVEVQQRLEAARRSLEMERREARRDLQFDVLREALQVTGRLLEEASDTTVQHQLVRRLVSTLENLPVAVRKEISSRWTPGAQVILESAEDVSKHDMQEITRVLEKVLQTRPDVAAHTRPDLIGGVRLELGGHVWDASLAGQLEHILPDGRLHVVL